MLEQAPSVLLENFWEQAFTKISNPTRIYIMYTKSMNAVFNNLSNSDFEIERIYDTKFLREDVTVYDFFNGQAPSNLNIANYEDNPAPSDKALIFTHAKLELLTVSAVDVATGKEAEKILNQLRKSYLEVNQGDNQTLEERFDIASLFNFAGISQGAADNTTLLVKSAAPSKLQEPWVVKPGVRHRHKLVVASATTFPGTDIADYQIRLSYDVIKLTRENARKVGFNV